MIGGGKNIHVYIIHVQGQEKRKVFMEKQMRSIGFSYEYVLDGNIEDITEDVLNKYFADNGQKDTMYGVYPRTSCAYKNFLTYIKFLKTNLDGILIFEDDIRLFSCFKSGIIACIEEIKQYHNGEPLIANFEESSLMLVARSERQKGQYLYRKERDRFAGCYYISREAAQAIMDYVYKEKCDLPIDLLHTKLVKMGLINYYWSYPCLAVQRSCDGSMPTMIQKTKIFKRLKWFYKRFYKHLLYWFR